MKQKITFYGLLHINDNDNNLNFKFNDSAQKINIYFLNAILLAKSLKSKKFDFVLLTNNKTYLQNLNKHEFSMNIEEINFKTQVIKESHFSSCHYRIDLFRFFSSKNNYSALIDLDVVSINDFSANLSNLIDEKRAVFINDISNNVIPAYGIEKIKKNLELVLGGETELKWYGGDLFLGPPEFFGELYNAVIFTYENFKKNFHLLKDQTDELFISAAIEIVRKKKKFNILNSREYGLLDRYWSVNTKHRQKSFYELKKNFLIHFPADKIFLSKIALDEYSNNFFVKSYIKYAMSIKKIVKNFLSKIYNFK
tara:strand:- start:321 stop:1250 length:930 start_codon:yes stop_codon:yes gene_type:complete